MHLLPRLSRIWFRQMRFSIATGFCRYKVTLMTMRFRRALYFRETDFIISASPAYPPDLIVVT